MSIILGTAHFVGRDEAARYYRDYENRDGYATVVGKMAAGEIHIGPPPLKPGETLTIVDNGTRYAIVEATPEVDIKRSFNPFIDRYTFDAKDCVPSKGWAQLDTSQDASYYGNWINPITFELVSYCEGDVTHTVCPSEKEFQNVLTATLQWHAERGYNPKIDGMLRPEIIEAFKRLGFEEYLH